jgi:hypothetical protein
MRITATDPDMRLALSAIVRRLIATEYARLSAVPRGVALEAVEVLDEYERDAEVLHTLEDALKLIWRLDGWVDLPVSPTALKRAVQVEVLRVKVELRADLDAGLPERRRLAAVRLASGLDKLCATDTHSRRAA